MVVVDALIPMTIMIASNVSIVVGPNILRTSVGIYIAVHKIYLHIHSNEADQTQLEVEVDLEVTDPVHVL